jgi:hypothetical protein
VDPETQTTTSAPNPPEQETSRTPGLRPLHDDDEKPDDEDNEDSRRSFVVVIVAVVERGGDSRFVVTAAVEPQLPHGQGQGRIGRSGPPDPKPPQKSTTI